jgi:hypothetical protein
MFLAAVTVVLIGCLFAILEYSDYLPDHRTRARVCGALAATALMGSVLAPNAYERAVEWYARHKAQEIQDIVDDLSPDTSPTTTPAG